MVIFSIKGSEASKEVQHTINILTQRQVLHRIPTSPTVSPSSALLSSTYVSDYEINIHSLPLFLFPCPSNPRLVAVFSVNITTDFYPASSFSSLAHTASAIHFPTMSAISFKGQLKCIHSNIFFNRPSFLILSKRLIILNLHILFTALLFLHSPSTSYFFVSYSFDPWVHALLG